MPSERLFSAADLILSNLQNSLTTENVDALLFLNKTILLLDAFESAYATWNKAAFAPAAHFAKTEPHEVDSDPDLPDVLTLMIIVMLYHSSVVLDVFVLWWG